MSSSSSEEECDVALLKESIATNFISNDLYQQSSKKKTNIERQILPSLRPKDDSDQQFDNLGVTLEFQQHVAEHLDVMLDESLQNKFIEFIPKKHKRKRKSVGIKLFLKSDTIIDKITEDFQPVNNKKLKIISNYQTLDATILKSLAVSPEDILNKKDTLHWSNRSKAKIFHYKKNNINGQLCAVD